MVYYVYWETKNGNTYRHREDDLKTLIAYAYKRVRDNKNTSLEILTLDRVKGVVFKRVMNGKKTYLLNLYKGDKTYLLNPDGSVGGTVHLDYEVYIHPLDNSKGGLIGTTPDYKMAKALLKAKVTQRKSILPTLGDITHGVPNRYIGTLRYDYHLGRYEYTDELTNKREIW